MNCPKCGSSTIVLESRPSGGSLRRRRECIECKNKFTTYEVDYNWYLCIKKMAEALKECAAIGDQME